jgi:FKBP-type peptidyl-prolyl cis-trans isomerase 2
MNIYVGNLASETSKDTLDRAFSVTIKDISEKTVMIDASQPLAGKDLEFDVKLIAIL